MSHIIVKQALSEAINQVAADISQYSVDASKNFLRTRKLPPDKLISFLISCGSSGTRQELLDFFDMNPKSPSASAFNQQRAKLKPEALEAVFHHFNSSPILSASSDEYRFLAADGSSFTFCSRSAFSPDEYLINVGHSAKGFFSMHLNALYDLKKHTYSDALIQPVHFKDEFRAFCDLVDRHILLPGNKDVFIGDRGYCSYNNMAHVIQKGQFFLFRSKDIHSKGLIQKFDFPDTDSFDITVNVTLIRSQRKSIPVPKGSYRRFVDANTSFDYIEYGSSDTYELSFRIVRFPISQDDYECLVTNLPEEEFPMQRLKILYYSRWAIEGSFRQLKYTIGLSNFHASKPEYIKQEIWAKLITYNMTETLINLTIIKKGETKYEYKVNFTVAAHICRVFLRPKEDPIDVMSLLCRELVPIRDDRQYPRLKTAHFRKPRYFIYRAA